MYVVTGTISYGQRAADLMWEIVNNSSRDIYYGDPIRVAEDFQLYTYSSMAIAFDWCYDQMDYAGHISEIVSHINTMVVNAVNDSNSILGPNAVGYKTEENWYSIALAYSIYGEIGTGSEILTAIERHSEWTKIFIGYYTDGGKYGGMPFSGSLWC